MDARPLLSVVALVDWLPMVNDTSTPDTAVGVPLVVSMSVADTVTGSEY